MIRGSRIQADKLKHSIARPMSCYTVALQWEGKAISFLVLQGLTILIALSYVGHMTGLKSLLSYEQENFMGILITTINLNIFGIYRDVESSSVIVKMRKMHLIINQHNMIL